MISIIACIGRNNELGRKNNLIWNIPRDMKFFRDTTMGHTVVMGLNTYRSIPGNLVGRKIIVLSYNEIEGDIEVAYSIDAILNKYLDTKEEIFICGGASIYNQFIKYADKLYLTLVDDVCLDADTFFPKIDESEWYKEIMEENVYENLKFKICLYRKKL